MIGFRLPENEQPDHIWDDKDQKETKSTENTDGDAAPRYHKPEDKNHD